MSKRRFDSGRRNTRKNKRTRKGQLKDPFLRIEDNEEITSEESGGEAPEKEKPEGEDEEVHADERRIRLAKKILAELEEEQMLKKDELGEDYVQNKLLDDVLKSKGRHFEPCSERITKNLPEAKVYTRRGHRQTATSIAVGTLNGREYAYTASKDGSIVKWDLKAKRVEHRIPYDPKGKKGHKGRISGLAVSGDGKLLASGGADRHIRLWSTETHEIVKVFWKAHRKAITCLAFSEEEFLLFSGSEDRHVIIWDCEAFARVHRAIGHNSRVTSIHCIGKELAVSSGEDCTLRLWDLGRDKQKIFQRYKSPHDSCSMLSRREFVSCSQGGQVSLWNTSRRKPTCTRIKVHGENWVTSITSVPHSDLVVSGSCDGFLRFLKKDGSQITEVAKLEIRRGWVNGLRFTKSTRFLVGATGRDHRLGRWETIKGAKNGILIVDLDPAVGRAEKQKRLDNFEKLKKLESMEIEGAVEPPTKTDKTVGEETIDSMQINGGGGGGDSSSATELSDASSDESGEDTSDSSSSEEGEKALAKEDNE